MDELVPIHDRNGKKAVSARELHTFLESKQDFSNWIKNRIQKYGLIEGQDYQVFDNLIENPQGGRPLIEYALSIEAAKELSMVEGNAKGKQARQYFIQCEKIANNIAILEPEEMLLQSVQLMLEQKKALKEIDKRVKAIEAKTSTTPNYFAIMGYASLNGIQVGLKMAANLGKKAKAICRSKGYPIEQIPDPRFGRVNTYPYAVLEQVFNEYTV